MVYESIVVETSATLRLLLFDCTRACSDSAIQPDTRDLAVGGIRFRTAPFFIRIDVLAKLDPFGFMDKLSTRVLHASFLKKIKVWG